MFNPRINSFKTDVLEAKVETIGSKYPFIFKNGNVAYKEFPIGGLISYLEDENGLFTNNIDKFRKVYRYDSTTISKVIKEIDEKIYSKNYSTYYI